MRGHIAYFVYIGILIVFSILSKSIKKSNSAKNNGNYGGNDGGNRGAYRPSQAMPVNRPSAMSHTHAVPASYETYNGKTRYNTAGAQPHVHDNRKYTSMADASHLPKGYILLNGEPVRVADLENK